MGDITPLQKLDFVPATVQAVCQTLVGAVGYPFLKKAPRTFNRHVLLTFMRALFARLSTPQLQYAIGTTESNFRAWAKSEGTLVQMIELSFANTKAFWIGQIATADAVVVYYHGGGYAMPGTVSHFKLLERLIAYAKSTKGKNVAGLVVQYDLAPSKQYPHQLVQSVEALRYVLERTGQTPGKVFLGGDSSGGNLVLAVLSHILHPHTAARPLHLSGPLAGAILHSPVVEFDFSKARFQTNQIFEPDSDQWSEPLRADSSWWRGLDKVIKEIAITVAKDEVFAEDVQALLPKVEAVYSGLTFFSSPKDFHAEPGIGYAVGLTEESEAAAFAKEWITERL